ncbi:MAG TPA: rod shape-determining protein MreC [Actinomycetota bacterium]|jgi:rod shape-determining protein MreC
MALSRRTRSTRVLVFVLVMVSLLTITVDYRGGQSGPLELAGKAGLTIVGPMQAAVSKVVRPVGSFFSAVIHLSSLESQNKALKQRLAEANAELATTTTAVQQNEQLRKLLQLQQRLGISGPTATVIAQSLSNFEWTITIDRGSSAGVKTDMAVVSGDGLVGHVSKVSDHWSIVTLLIDPSSSVAGRLVTTGDTGLVVGERTQDMQMQLVSPGAKVDLNESVVTAGFTGSLYPPGITIGAVSHVYRSNGSLAETVAVRPAVDFSSLQFVTVVTSP